MLRAHTTGGQLTTSLALLCIHCSGAQAELSKGSIHLIQYSSIKLYLDRGRIELL